MADNTIESRGTELFISVNGTAAIKLTCPTSIGGGGVSANLQEIDCLDAAAAYDRPTGRKVKPWNVPFIVQAGDAAHKFVLEQLNTSTLTTQEVPYAIAWSDGATDPTISAGNFTAPSGRTSIIGKGYITDVTLDHSGGDVLRASLTLTPTSQTYTAKV